MTNRAVDGAATALRRSASIGERAPRVGGVPVSSTKIRASQAKLREALVVEPACQAFGVRFLGHPLRCARVGFAAVCLKPVTQNHDNSPSVGEPVFIPCLRGAGWIVFLGSSNDDHDEDQPSRALVSAVPSVKGQAPHDCRERR